MATTTPTTTYWSYQRATEEPPEVVNLLLLNGATIVTDETGRGQFRIIDVPSGKVQYVFDPDALPPDRDYWSSYRAFAGAKPGSVVLFNQTDRAYRLDLRTGNLIPFTTNVENPEGSVLRAYFGQRVMFLAPTSARIRTSAEAE